jgi:probable DNA metabolism protein
LYDKTFEGLLSVIYYAYDTKIFPDKIYDELNYQDDIFATKYSVLSCSEYAQKVWETIKKRASKETCDKIYKVFMSELPEIEILIFKYVELTLKAPINIEKNYSNAIVVDLNKIHRKVVKEAHRIFMFTRIQKTKEGIYFEQFEPQ